MAYSNIDSLNLGKIVQIIFTNGVHRQINVAYPDFEAIKRAKIDDVGAREIRFFFQNSLGTGAVQYRNPGTTGRAFPTAQQITAAENTAKLKEIDATIELEQNLYHRAVKTPMKYGKPLEIEINSKLAAARKRIAADLYGDGTGVLGTISSQTTTSNQAVVTLSTTNTAVGHAGNFEFNEPVVHKAANGGSGSSVTLASGTFDHWTVVSKDRDNQTITLQAVDTNGANQNLSSWTPTAGEVLYKTGQPTFADTTSVSDYGTVTEAMPGLESLVAADGRTVFGITMSGATAGTRYDAGGNPIDNRHFQRALSRVKTIVGQGMYKFPNALMAPETKDALIESRESDRRYVAAADGTRGVSTLKYVHDNDQVNMITSEYCPPKRIYIPGEGLSGDDQVLEFHGTDFETVKQPGGADFMLKPASSGGGFQNVMVSYLQMYGILICNRPAAVAVIHNFTNS